MAGMVCVANDEKRLEKGNTGARCMPNLWLHGRPRSGRLAAVVYRLRDLTSENVSMLITAVCTSPRKLIPTLVAVGT